MVEVNVLEILQISPFPDILAAKAVGIYSSFSHLILQDPKKQWSVKKNSTKDTDANVSFQNFYTFSRSTRSY